MIRSVYGKLKEVYLLSKTVGSGDSTTSVLDLQGFHSAWLVFTAGVFALTGTNKVTLTLLESVDGTTYGTVSQADVEGGESSTVFRAWDSSASDASSAYSLHYKGNKRYLKATLAEGGTVSVPMSCVAILGSSDMKPSID